MVMVYIHIHTNIERVRRWAGLNPSSCLDDLTYLDPLAKARIASSSEVLAFGASDPRQIAAPQLHCFCFPYGSHTHRGGVRYMGVKTRRKGGNSGLTAYLEFTFVIGSKLIII